MQTKLWSLAAVAVGALIGGRLGLLYGTSTVRQACEKPDASNLCGLTSAPTVPFYVAAGTIIGAAVAVLAIVVILGRRKT